MTHGTYDPDDDSTKTPANGYGYAYLGDGVTLPTTPEEALDLLGGYIGEEADRPDIDEAFGILITFIKQVREHGSMDLEWGEPGSCYDRLAQDTDVLVAMRQEGLEGAVDATYIEVATRLGYGRHYGDPHCIWCLEAS